jgi:hypothetical protein
MANGVEEMATFSSILDSAGFDLNAASSALTTAGHDNQVVEDQQLIKATVDGVSVRAYLVEEDATYKWMLAY